MLKSINHQKLTINHKGFTLVEVTVVLFIASVVLGGLIILATTTLRSATFSRNKAVAEKLALRVMEEAKTVRAKKGWSYIVSTIGSQSGCTAVDTTNWVFTPNPFVSCSDSRFNEIVNSITYTKKLSFTCSYVTSCSGSNINYFIASVVVEWNDQKGLHTTSLKTRWYCYKGEVVALGLLC